MKKIQDTINALKLVFSNKIYIVLSLLSSFSLFSLNPIFRNFSVLKADFSFKLLYFLIIGTFTSFSVSSLISLFIISILGGIVISLSIFLVRRQINEGIATGSSSILIAIVAPACPSCALGMLSLFGFGGFLAFLPFKGLELGIIGILILLFSIVYMSKKINTKVCAIN